jgi:hypothetical protein
VRAGPDALVVVVLGPVVAQPRLRRRPTARSFDGEPDESVDLALAPRGRGSLVVGHQGRCPPPRKSRGIPAPIG